MLTTSDKDFLIILIHELCIEEKASMLLSHDRFLHTYMTS
jgi:hypothetical protein